MSASHRGEQDAGATEDPPSHGAYLYEQQPQSEGSAMQEDQMYSQQQHYTPEEVAAMAAAADASSGNEAEDPVEAAAAVNAAYATAATRTQRSTSRSTTGGEHLDGQGETIQAHAGPSRSNTAKSSAASKRQRVHFSCTECHRRKQKCNREVSTGAIVGLWVFGSLKVSFLVDE